MGGAVALAAVIVAVRVAWGHIDGATSSRTVDVVLFENARMVKEGTEVYLEGVCVGHVKSVRPLAPRPPDREMWTRGVMYQAKEEWKEEKDGPEPMEELATVAIVTIVQPSVRLDSKSARAEVRSDRVTGVARIHLSVTSSSSKAGLPDTVLSLPLRSMIEEMERHLEAATDLKNHAKEMAEWCKKATSAAPGWGEGLRRAAQGAGEVATGLRPSPNRAPDAPPAHDAWADALKDLGRLRKALEEVHISVPGDEIRRTLEARRRDLVNANQQIPRLAESWGDGLDSFSKWLGSVLREVDEQVAGHGTPSQEGTR